MTLQTVGRLMGVIGSVGIMLSPFSALYWSGWDYGHDTSGFGILIIVPGTLLAALTAIAALIKSLSVNDTRSGKDMVITGVLSIFFLGFFMLGTFFSWGRADSLSKQLVNLFAAIGPLLLLVGGLFTITETKNKTEP